MFQKLREHVFRVRGAYRILFRGGQNSENVSIAGEIVLADLRRFCRANSTPAVVSRMSGMVDPIATGIAVGRLEVWHRIIQNLHLSDADLVRMMEADAANAARDQ